MNTNVRTPRSKRIAAWAVLGVFLLGFFSSSVGAWTGPTLGTWFVGTQRVRRGFMWMLAFTLLFGLPNLLRHLPHDGLEPIAANLGWMLLAMVLGVLPFTFHRMVSPRLTGFISTLPLALFAVVFAALGRAWLPAGIASAYNQQPSLILQQVGAILGVGAALFLVYWFAAVVVWMWNHEFRAAKIGVGASLFAAFAAVIVAMGVVRELSGTALPETPPAGAIFSWICLAGATAVSGRALFVSRQKRAWECRPETLRILESPATGEPLQLVRKDHEQWLVSASNERFSIRDGVADLRSPEDLTGSNLKYNHLYETIGGFYDDAQRVSCALTGIDRDAYVMSYLGLLEVKPGDSVLETSVGTGLNFKYLPQGARLSGIDLSAEMLANCRSNLRRWQLEADLFLANAESLPFADCSFDVVFHVGGINFFNDRAKAIREMIRLAKPGSRILIADETEEHVKAAFERAPVTGRYFKNRKEPVTAPVDLVPPEMLETHLEILNVVGRNRFYALTFRKPEHGESRSDKPALGVGLATTASGLRP